MLSEGTVSLSRACTHKLTLVSNDPSMSALPPKADKCGLSWIVRFVPEAALPLI